MTNEEADDRVQALYGDDVFCGVDYAGRCEVFYSTENDVILLGRGGDWDEAFEEAKNFAARFYPLLIERRCLK